MEYVSPEELNRRTEDTVSEGEPLDFNAPPFRGSFQQLLFNNMGKTVKIDFLMATSSIITQTGVITGVGVSYVLLRQRNGTVVAGDVYSIKFVTFLD